MTWNLTLIAVHVCAALICGALFCQAPDKLQKLVLGLVALCALAMIGYYSAELAGFDPPWQFRLAALNTEHIAVLIYLFRLLLVVGRRGEKMVLIVDHAFVERAAACRNSSPESPASPA